MTIKIMMATMKISDIGDAAAWRAASIVLGYAVVVVVFVAVEYMFVAGPFMIFVFIGHK